MVTTDQAIEPSTDCATDAPLLALARGGNTQAFSQLVQPLEERLYRQAFVICHNETIAEELAQETLIAAWKGIRRFDGNCQLFTWLYAILIRLHRKRLRTLSRKPLLFWGLVQWNHQHPEAAPDHEGSLEANPASKAKSKRRSTDYQRSTKKSSD